MKSIYKSLALAAAFVCGAANATTVFENGTDGNYWGGNNPFTYTIVTNDFALSDAATLTSLTYNAFTDGNTGSVTNVLVNFYADNGGSVGSLLFSGNYSVASTSVVGGDGYYSYTDYTVDLPNVSLAAGSYFLGLEVSLNDGTEHWSIANPAVASGQTGSDGFGHYFRLDSNVSSVPETGSSTLMLLGLGALGAAALRRKAKQQ